MTTDYNDDIMTGHPTSTTVPVNETMNYSYNNHNNHNDDHHYGNNNVPYSNIPSNNYHDNHLTPPPLTIEHKNRDKRSASYSSASSPTTPIDNNHSNKMDTPADTIEQLVQQGILLHEKGQLEKATEIFRKAAESDYPIGMFLYGVSLRHGWGCKKNEHVAFQYLQKAAEHAVEDLTNIANTVNASASKGEFIMAIYELGVSFRHGWGCKKDKESAVYFFKIAADLGDPDAQNDLGHCYYQGQGVKKDLSMAAKYYRKADKQGQGIMGNSWIWKSKYDPK